MPIFEPFESVDYIYEDDPEFEANLPPWFQNNNSWSERYITKISDGTVAVTFRDAVGKVWTYEWDPEDRVVRHWVGDYRSEDLRRPEEGEEPMSHSTSHLEEAPPPLGERPIGEVFGEAGWKTYVPPDQPIGEALGGPPKTFNPPGTDLSDKKLSEFQPKTFNPPPPPSGETLDPTPSSGPSPFGAPDPNNPDQPPPSELVIDPVLIDPNETGYVPLPPDQPIGEVFGGPPKTYVPTVSDPGSGTNTTEPSEATLDPNESEGPVVPDDLVPYRDYLPLVPMVQDPTTGEWRNAEPGEISGVGEGDVGQPTPGNDGVGIPGLGVPYQDFIPFYPMVEDPNTGEWRNVEPGELSEPQSVGLLQFGNTANLQNASEFHWLSDLFDPDAPGPTLDPNLFNPNVPGLTLDPRAVLLGRNGPAIDPALLDPNAPGPTIDPSTLGPAYTLDLRIVEPGDPRLGEPGYVTWEQVASETEEQTPEMERVPGTGEPETEAEPPQEHVEVEASAQADVRSGVPDPGMPFEPGKVPTSVEGTAGQSVEEIDPDPASPAVPPDPMGPVASEPTVNPALLDPSAPGPTLDLSLFDAEAPGPTLDPSLFDPAAPGPTIDPALLDPASPGPTMDPNALDPNAPGETVDPNTLDPAAPGPTVDPSELNTSLMEPAGVTDPRFTDPSLTEPPPPQPDTMDQSFGDPLIS